MLLNLKEVMFYIWHFYHILMDYFKFTIQHDKRDTNKLNTYESSGKCIYQINDTLGMHREISWTIK